MPFWEGTRAEQGDNTSVSALFLFPSLGLVHCPRCQSNVGRFLRASSPSFPSSHPTVAPQSSSVILLDGGAVSTRTCHTRDTGRDRQRQRRMQSQTRTSACAKSDLGTRPSKNLQRLEATPQPALPPHTQCTYSIYTARKKYLWGDSTAWSPR